MREKQYFVALDDYEHGVVIRSLNDEKTGLKNQGKSTDAVDDLLVKFGNAPTKKFKVIEKRSR
jgi:hemerythrin